MTDHPVVSREQWIAAREALLAKEKEFTRQRDRLSEERRQLPWVEVNTPYVFEGPNGEETLSDLFARSQPSADGWLPPEEVVLDGGLEDRGVVDVV